MREALARSDLDFTTSEPDKPRSVEIVRLPKILRAACVSTAILVCGVIVVNALFLQDRKHAAPLLRAPDATIADPIEAPRPVPRAVAIAPAAQSAPASAPTIRNGRDAIADELARSSGAERRPAKPAVVAKPVEEKTAKPDAIANLIGGGAQEPSAHVMAAQKALVRLGYVLRADGMPGVTTRQAIERYERDNKLPVRGELTARLARELATKSGVPAQ